MGHLPPTATLRQALSSKGVWSPHLASGPALTGGSVPVHCQYSVSAQCAFLWDLRFYWCESEYCKGSCKAFPLTPPFAPHQQWRQFMTRLLQLRQLDSAHCTLCSFWSSGTRRSLRRSHRSQMVRGVWLDDEKAGRKSLGFWDMQVFWVHLEITLEGRPFSCFQPLTLNRSKEQMLRSLQSKR